MSHKTDYSGPCDGALVRQSITIDGVTCVNECCEHRAKGCLYETRARLLRDWNRPAYADRSERDQLEPHAPAMDRPCALPRGARLLLIDRVSVGPRVVPRLDGKPTDTANLTKPQRAAYDYAKENGVVCAGKSADKKGNGVRFSAASIASLGRMGLLVVGIGPDGGVMGKLPV